MKNYAELIEALRYLAKVYSICENENTQEYQLAVQAADAIEKLTVAQLTQTNAESTQKCVRPTQDCVSRQAAIDALNSEKVAMAAYKDGVNHGNPFRQYNQGLTDGIATLMKLPAAQPQRTRGRWITQEFGSWAKCSECHELYDIPIANSNFCPNCGAEMDGGQDDS